ncbi:hypothetical protein FPRO04_01468 [Fusarium proliferatum]|nr:hypothetical protein FPRO04_01468 [Fusarium proliferatum]
MSSNGFANGLSMPTGGLAARRGGQNPKPLSVDLINQTKDQDSGAPTPRTSRSHLLAGLRTAPKSATAASFGPQSPTTAGPTQQTTPTTPPRRPIPNTPSTPGFGGFHHQQNTPSVQVSPPVESQPFSFRSNSPPKRYESPTEVAPLPPPSANAFRRGHKKASSLAPVNSVLAASLSSDAPKSAGPKTSTFPITPLTGGYGPGQARAGEHPIRQPRGPPSLDELKAKPTAKHEGSKNFSARTRRSAVHNLVRAGLERRKGTGSSCGSMSPVSETAEESSTPITDNESDSGRSGSGSLAGDMECPSSRTSASGSWGAIGSDRPSSRQKARKSVDSVDSVASNTESENSSFANVFKNGALRAAKAQDSADSQRKAPRLVLTKSTPAA